MDTGETRLGAQVAIRLPEDTAAFLVMIASHNGRTVAEEERLALQRHVESELARHRAEAMTDDELDAELGQVDALSDERPGGSPGDVESQAGPEPDDARL